jgi:molybdopterin converting factor subunit 1
LKPPVEISFVMRVLLFAHLKDAAGVGELETKLTESLDVDGLWCKLIAAHPELAKFRTTTRLARNGEYADAQTRFTDADEAALIPPVSGG